MFSVQGLILSGMFSILMYVIIEGIIKIYRAYKEEYKGPLIEERKVR